MQYYDKRTVSGEFEAVVDAVETALSEEGFGVLCEIPVDEKLTAKLGLEEYPKYRILGACSPPHAHEALDHEPDLGTLLPCNVVVYENDEDVVVSAVNPTAMLSVVDNPDLDPVAEAVDESFDRVLESLDGTETTAD